MNELVIWLWNQTTYNYMSIGVSFEKKSLIDNSILYCPRVVVKISQVGGADLYLYQILTYQLINLPKKKWNVFLCLPFLSQQSFVSTSLSRTRALTLVALCLIFKAGYSARITTFIRQHALDSLMITDWLVVIQLQNYCLTSLLSYLVA